MRLRQLLRQAFAPDTGSVSGAGVTGMPDMAAVPDRDVTAVVQDHRLIVPGALFVARSGASFDGRRFLAEAAAAGAVAAVAEASPLLADAPLPVVIVPDARAAIAPLAATFHGQPSRRMTVVGVTGTDGKTSTSFLLHHLLATLHPTGLLSTAAAYSGTADLDTIGHFTTPEAPEVQAFLARMAADGCTHAVVESSSHGLAAHRLDAIDYDLAIWTNLSPEHLDFHGDMDSYLEAKAQLVRRAGVAVLNADDPACGRFAAFATDVTSYGFDAAADWRIADLVQVGAGLRFNLVHGADVFAASVPLAGNFNAFNAAAAVAAAVRLGTPAAEAVAALESFPGVPGRMQLIAAEPFGVLVDFAHTGPALEKALAAARGGTNGRVILVVGAAGERDPGKRAPIGRAAALGAELTVFTEEDSRSEDAAAILAELAAGAAAAGGATVSPEALSTAASSAAPTGGLPGAFMLVPDRREAIRTALAAARPGDLVLLAGKGVEKTLERAHETIPWDERRIALELIHELS